MFISSNMCAIRFSSLVLTDDMIAILKELYLLVRQMMSSFVIGSNITCSASWFSSKIATLVLVLPMSIVSTIGICTIICKGTKKILKLQVLCLNFWNLLVFLVDGMVIFVCVVWKRLLWYGL